MLAREMLEGLGFAVRRVTCAPAALAKLENGHAVDLVFSDVVMPGGMSNIELARELARRRPDLPILLTSGFSDGQRDGDAEDLRLLRKPYRLDELEAALAGRLWSAFPLRLNRLPDGKPKMRELHSRPARFAGRGACGASQSPLRRLRRDQMRLKPSPSSSSKRLA